MGLQAMPIMKTLMSVSLLLGAMSPLMVFGSDRIGSAPTELSALLQTLEGKQAEVAGRCIGFWRKEGSVSLARRKLFFEKVGDVARFDSYLVSERGVDYGGTFEGSFIGRVNSGGYLLVYVDDQRSLIAESSEDDLAELFKRIELGWDTFKGDSRLDVAHNLCRFVTIQSGSARKSYLQHSSLAWMSDEERAALGLELSHLEALEAQFKGLLIGQLSVPWR